MSEEIQPFTAEEWANGGAEVIDGYVDMEMGTVDVSLMWGLRPEEDAREARLLAALLLQRAAPNGGPLFTWEMVEALEEMVGNAIAFHENWCFGEEAIAAAQLVARVQAIIAALRSLLPPRKES